MSKTILEQLEQRITTATQPGLPGPNIGLTAAFPPEPSYSTVPVPSFDAPANIQNFIHVSAVGSKPTFSQKPQASFSSQAPSATASTQQPQSTQQTAPAMSQKQAVIFHEPAKVITPEKANPNWRFESNPNHQMPLLELQRQHQPAASATYQASISGQHEMSRPRGKSDDDSGIDLNVISHQPGSSTTTNQAGTAASTTAATYSRTSTPLKPAQGRAVGGAGGDLEMADFTDEKATADLMSDNDDENDIMRTLQQTTNRRPPPDSDRSAILLSRSQSHMPSIPQDPNSPPDQFDCQTRQQEMLRQDIGMSRQFNSGSSSLLDPGMTQQQHMRATQEGSILKQELGGMNQQPFDESREEGGVLDDDDEIFEVDEGLFQTASGHLIVQNQTGPVLSEQEQRAIARRTRQEMKKRIEERNLVEYGGKCDDEKFIDFSQWPQDFPTLQAALDMYNKLGLPHRIMFRLSDHQRDQGGLSTRFKLVCFHNKQIAGQHKNIQNSTNTGVQFKKHRQGTCPVSMTFKFKPNAPHSKRGIFIRSNHVIMQHNHALTVDERRVLQRVEIQDEIQMYLESGLSMPMIVNCVNRKFGLSLPYSAFGSVIQKVRHQIHSYIDFTQTQTMQLLQMLEKMRQEDPMTRFAYLFDSHLKQRDDIDPTNPQIECLLIQTPLMARNYAQFHDVVFLDSTYNTNQLGLALAILSGISAEGKNIFLGFAFMARETTENYQWVLENFVKMNNNQSPRTILTDYDSAMATAIETTFSRNTTHFLCQWHMMQNFKKHFVFLSKRRGAAGKLLFNHIIDCIFVESPKKFSELTDVIFSTDQLDEKRLGYLRKMFMIKEKWATAHQPPVFNAGMHTTSRVEAMNSMVKKAMQSRYTLVNLFQEILKIEQRVIRASREVLSVVDSNLVVNNPLMASIRGKYAKWAFERMLYQHMLSHTFVVVPVTDEHVPNSDIFRLKNDRTVFRVRDTETQDKCTVILIQNSIVDPDTGATFDNIRCNCRYYLSHEFFCSHIFSVLNLLQIKNAEKFHMIGRRWQRDHQELVLPGLYTMHDRTTNPEQYASQFKLYANNGTVNQSYVFGGGPGGGDDAMAHDQGQYTMINTIGNVDFVDTGNRQVENGGGGDQGVVAQNEAAIMASEQQMREQMSSEEYQAPQNAHLIKNEAAVPHQHDFLVQQQLNQFAQHQHQHQHPQQMMSPPQQQAMMVGQPHQQPPQTVMLPAQPGGTHFYRAHPHQLASSPQQQQPPSQQQLSSIIKQQSPVKMQPQSSPPPPTTTTTQTAAAYYDFAPPPVQQLPTQQQPMMQHQHPVAEQQQQYAQQQQQFHYQQQPHPQQQLQYLAPSPSPPQAMQHHPMPPNHSTQYHKSPQQMLPPQTGYHNPHQLQQQQQQQQQHFQQQQYLPPQQHQHQGVAAGVNSPPRHSLVKNEGYLQQ